MQRQDRLLFLALDRDRLDARLLHRGPARPRVVRIVLVAADEGPDHLRRQKPDLVTELPDPACPMLRAAAGLHRDQARRAIGEMFQKLRPHQPQVDDLARLHIDPMQLEYPLRRIHADDRFVSLHLGPSCLPVKSSLFQLGTLMPSAGEGPPQPSRLPGMGGVHSISPVHVSSRARRSGAMRSRKSESARREILGSSRTSSRAASGRVIHSGRCNWVRSGCRTISIVCPRALRRPRHTTRQPDSGWKR